jgi:folate-binding protein YgfZ
MIAHSATESDDDEDKPMKLTMSQNLAREVEAYEAAHRSAVLVDRSNLGVLKLTGETRLDLINRMSTQKVNELQPGQGAATVLTTDIGRILDRLLLFVDSDSVLCLTGEDNGDSIARYLMRFVFFMDDFQVADLSAETAILGVYGAQAQTILATLLDQPIDLARHYWQEHSLEGIPLSLHRTDPVAGDGYLIICHQDDGQAVWTTLAAGGLTPASEETFDYLRIESGQPRFGHELTLDYIPLEAGLWPDVSFNKGCYTGQEIIARMESRGRLAKRLVRLQSAKPLEIGANLTAHGKQAGTITSVSDGPRGPLALGYVKTSFLDDDSPELFAGDLPVRVTAVDDLEVPSA